MENQGKTNKQIEDSSRLFIIGVVAIILTVFVSYIYNAVGGEKNRAMREAHKTEIKR